MLFLPTKVQLSFMKVDSFLLSLIFFADGKVEK